MVADRLANSDAGFLEITGSHFGTDKVAHGYMPAYATHFAPLRHEPIWLLEVGAWKGASLRMWRHYFDHPDTRIMSVDIGHGGCEPDPETYELITADIKIWQPPDGLALDIAIDDGSHFTPDMVAAFNKLFPLVKPGGWYVIEDLETQFVSSGAWGHHNIFGSSVIDMIRSMTAHSLRDRTHGDLGPMAPRSEVSEVHCYEQICFLRKAN